MTEENTNIIGNLSTIVKTILMMFAGAALGALASMGLDLPIDETQLTEISFTILCFIAAYIDAKYPNTFKFLGNSKNNTEQQLVLKEIVLNEEYETTDEGGGEDGC